MRTLPWRLSWRYYFSIRIRKLNFSGSYVCQLFETERTQNAILTGSGKDNNAETSTHWDVISNPVQWGQRESCITQWKSVSVSNVKVTPCQKVKGLMMSCMVDLEANSSPTLMLTSSRWPCVYEQLDFNLRAQVGSLGGTGVQFGGENVESKVNDWLMVGFNVRSMLFPGAVVAAWLVLYR